MSALDPQYRALTDLLTEDCFPLAAIQAPEPRLLPAEGLPLQELANQPRVVIDLKALHKEVR